MLGNVLRVLVPVIHCMLRTSLKDRQAHSLWGQWRNRPRERVSSFHVTMESWNPGTRMVSSLRVKCHGRGQRHTCYWRKRAHVRAQKQPLSPLKSRHGYLLIIRIQGWVTGTFRIAIKENGQGNLPRISRIISCMEGSSEVGALSLWWLQSRQISDLSGIS